MDGLIHTVKMENEAHRKVDDYPHRSPGRSIKIFYF